MLQEQLDIQRDVNEKLISRFFDVPTVDDDKEETLEILKSSGWKERLIERARREHLRQSKEN